MSEEENIITEFVQHSTGFVISKCDLTTGKVVVNNIEITSVEDWNKVTKSLFELQQENRQLKSVLKEIREYIKEQTKEIENTNDKTTHCLSYQDLIDEYKELLEIIDKAGIGEEK